MNICGAAVAKNAPNRDNAVKLLEYLVSPEAQEIYASANLRVSGRRPAPRLDPIIAALGDLKIDPLPLTEAPRSTARRRASSSTRSASTWRCRRGVE